MVEKLEGEIFIPIFYKNVDYSGLYEISNMGRVKSLERDVVCDNKTYHKGEQVLKPGNSRKDGNGYLFVALYKEGEKTIYPKIHQLVANAFIENPNNFTVVGHMDDNKLNNIVSNLYWTTSQENSIHNDKQWKIAEINRKSGLYKKHSKPIYQIDKKTKEIIREWDSAAKASATLNVKHCGISNCCRGLQKTAHGYIWKFKYEMSQS